MLPAPCFSSVTSFSLRLFLAFAGYVVRAAFVLLEPVANWRPVSHGDVAMSTAFLQRRSGQHGTIGARGEGGESSVSMLKPQLKLREMVAFPH